MEVIIPSVLPPYQPNKPTGNDETLPKSEDFDEVVQQVNQAKDFLESKIKVSSNWFIRWTSPALQNPPTLSTTALNLRVCSNEDQEMQILQPMANKNDLHKSTLWIPKGNQSKSR